MKELPVTFEEQYTMKQIERLNLKRIKFQDKVRGIYDSRMTDHIVFPPDSHDFTTSKAMMKFVTPLNLYFNTNIEGMTTNSALLDTMRTLTENVAFCPRFLQFVEFLGTQMVIKSNVSCSEYGNPHRVDYRADDGISQNARLALFKEFYIGTRLNHLRKYIPNFIYTFGYFMCPLNGNHGRRGALDCDERIANTFSNKVTSGFTMVPAPKKTVETLWNLNKSFNKFFQKEEHKLTCDEWDQSRYLALDNKLIQRDMFDAESKKLRSDPINVEGKSGWFNNDSDYKWFIRTPHLLLESIPGAMSLNHFLKGKLVSEEMIYSIYFQVLLALEMARERFGFVHGHLHLSNVMINELAEPTDIIYYLGSRSYKITTKHVAVIIDYEGSFIIENNIPIGFPLVDGYKPSVDIVYFTSAIEALLNNPRKKKQLKNFYPKNLLIITRERNGHINTTSRFETIVESVDFLLNQYPILQEYVSRIRMTMPIQLIYWEYSDKFLGLFFDRRPCNDLSEGLIPLLKERVCSYALTVAKRKIVSLNIEYLKDQWGCRFTKNILNEKVSAREDENKEMIALTQNADFEFLSQPFPEKQELQPFKNIPDREFFTRFYGGSSYKPFYMRYSADPDKEYSATREVAIEMAKWYKQAEPFVNNFKLYEKMISYVDLCKEDLPREYEQYQKRYYQYVRDVYDPYFQMFSKVKYFLQRFIVEFMGAISHVMFDHREDSTTKEEQDAMIKCLDALCELQKIVPQLINVDYITFMVSQKNEFLAKKGR